MVRAMLARLYGRIRDARGQGLVEFAFALPLLVIILVGIVQFGIAYSNYLQLTDAVRVGGRAGATQASDSANPTTQPAACTAAKTAAQADLSAGTYTCVGTTITGATPNDPAITLTGTRPYSISILGVVVKSGSLTSTATERLS
jgi:Flp pilus assembly protein TadG